MPRIIIATDAEPTEITGAKLNERVTSSILNDDHAAAQVLERVAWAIVDAEEAETPPSLTPVGYRSRHLRPVG